MTRNKGREGERYTFSCSRRMREIGFLDTGRIKLDFQTEGNTRQVGEKLGIPEIDGNGNCDETRDVRGNGGGRESERKLHLSEIAELRREIE